MKTLLHLNDEALDKISGGPGNMAQHGPVNFTYDFHGPGKGPDIITFDNSDRVIEPGPPLRRE